MYFQLCHWIYNECTTLRRYQDLLLLSRHYIISACVVYLPQYSTHRLGMRPRWWSPCRPTEPSGNFVSATCQKGASRESALWDWGISAIKWIKYDGPRTPPQALMRSSASSPEKFHPALQTRLRTRQQVSSLPKSTHNPTTPPLQQPLIWEGGGCAAQPLSDSAPLPEEEEGSGGEPLPSAQAPPPPPSFTRSPAGRWP